MARNMWKCGPNLRVAIEREAVEGGVIFTLTPIVAGKEGRSGTVGPVDQAIIAEESQRLGVSEDQLIVDEFLRDAELDGRATLTALGADTGGRGNKVAFAVVMAMIFFLGFCAGLDPEGAAAPPRKRMTGAELTAWYQSGATGTTESQAMRFLVAVAEKRDDAVCKAAIWCVDDAIRRQQDPKFDRVVESVVAARCLLREREWADVVRLVRRDAHLFGWDPDTLLARLKGVIEE